MVKNRCSAGKISRLSEMDVIAADFGTPEVCSRNDYLLETRGQLGVITFCHSSRS